MQKNSAKYSTKHFSFPFAASGYHLGRTKFSSCLPKGLRSRRILQKENPQCKCSNRHVSLFRTELYSRSSANWISLCGVKILCSSDIPERASLCYYKQIHDKEALRMASQQPVTNIARNVFYNNYALAIAKLQFYANISTSRMPLGHY